MCQYMEGQHLLPGWGCCNESCKSYNGLQRLQCKICQHVRHKIEIPETIFQCHTCGFGVNILMWQRNFYMTCPACHTENCLDLPMHPRKV